MIIDLIQNNFPQTLHTDPFHLFKKVKEYQRFNLHVKPPERRHITLFYTASTWHELR